MEPSTNRPDEEDTMRDEYDFSALGPAVRGKYYQQFQQRLRVVRLADDVAAAFASEDAVNEALRQYLRAGGQAAPVKN